MGNLSAVVFLVASFFLPLAVPSVRRNTNVLLACWLTIGIHHAVGFFNAFVAPISTTWGDLYGFHNSARGAWADIQEPYVRYLWLMYKVFGASFWFGSVLAVLAYSCVLPFLVDLVRRMGKESATVPIILLYGLMPGPLAHTSVPLRESYQALAFTVILWFLVSARQDGILPRRLVGFLFASTCLILLHQSLVLFVGAVILIGVPLVVDSRNVVGVIAVFVALGSLGLLALQTDMLKSSASVQALESGNFVKYASEYRNMVNNARSDYGMKLDLSDPIAAMSSYGQILFMYYMAPLPWQIGSLIDYLVSMESMVRLACLGSFAFYFSKLGDRQREFLLVFGVTITLEAMWAVGTTNWGTAMRHHVPAYIGFLLLGSSSLAKIRLSAEFQQIRARQMLRKESWSQLSDTSPRLGLQSQSRS